MRIYVVLRTRIHALLPYSLSPYPNLTHTNQKTFRSSWLSSIYFFLSPNRGIRSPCGKEKAKNIKHSRCIILGTFLQARSHSDLTDKKTMAQVLTTPPEFPQQINGRATFHIQLCPTPMPSSHCISFYSQSDP